MRRKYILLKQLYVKSPFTECSLRFVVKKRQKDQLIHSQLEFVQRPITSSPEVYIDFAYHHSQRNDLAIFVIAVSSGNRVANLGCLNLCLDENAWQKKEYLKGIIEQNGFVIYSSRNEPFPEAITIGESIVDYQIENKKESSVVAEYNWKGQESLSSEVTPLKLISDETEKKSEFDAVAITESRNQPNKFLLHENSPNISKCSNFNDEYLPSEVLKSQILNDSNNISKLAKAISSPQVICSKATLILRQHKLKNSRHISDLAQLQTSFQQQQQRLKELGLID